MEYGWRFGYTSAQIDLMVMDQPKIEYNVNDKKGKKSMIATKQEEDEMKKGEGKFAVRRVKLEMRFLISKGN